MNQILDTGEEQFKNNNINYGNYNQNKKQKVYKEKSVIEINKIVIITNIILTSISNRYIILSDNNL